MFEVLARGLVWDEFEEVDGVTMRRNDLCGGCGKLCSGPLRLLSKDTIKKVYREADAKERGELDAFRASGTVVPAQPRVAEQSIVAKEGSSSTMKIMGR